MKKIILFTFLISSSLVIAQMVSFSNEVSIIGSGPSGHSCVVDMNNDYLDDVVRVSSNELYIDYQQTDGTFTQQIFNMPSFQTTPSWSIAAGDINADGYNDLLFGGGLSVSFILSNSDGTVYTEDHQAPYIFSQRSTFADIDNDGHLDAFVCHDIDQSHPYRNDGLGNLTEDQTLIETLNLAGNYAAIWVDYDNDRDIDLFMTKCRQGSSSGNPERTNAMYRNNGDGTFTEVGAELNLDDNSMSWATTFQDFDNDGDMDCFVVNHDFTNSFMRNDIDTTGNFTEIIDATQINKNDLGAWECTSADFNNDGYIDIFSELNNELYLNNGDMTFTGQNLDFDEGGIGDFNDDGFLDVHEGNSTLNINNGNSNNWVKLNLKGTESNLNGIGARIEVETDSFTQIRDLRSGEGFSHMSSLNIHFGIGADTQIKRITIYWPSGVVDNLINSNSNETHLIEEGSTTLDVNDSVYVDLIVYPIPAKNELNLKSSLDLSNHIISIFDINGKRVLNQAYKTNSINISKLERGTYFLRIENKGKIFNQSFIKE